MEAILQDRLAVAPWMAPPMARLPGTVPVDPAAWLVTDEVHARQMALRDRLIAERPAEVLAEHRGPAGQELLDAVLGAIGAAGPGPDPRWITRAGPDAVTRADGITVPLDRDHPLRTAGRLVQEDLLILEKPPGAAEHVLTAGVLCFPSNWRLGQKLGHGLARIHLPVADYDDGIARRVQRLFDGLHPDRPILRANMLAYGTPALFNPRDEFDRHQPAIGASRYIRVERQVLKKLPATRAVVFSIHTHIVRPDALTAAERAGLMAVRPDLLGEPCASSS